MIWAVCTSSIFWHQWLICERAARVVTPLRGLVLPLNPNISFMSWCCSGYNGTPGLFNCLRNTDFTGCFGSNIFHFSPPIHKHCHHSTTNQNTRTIWRRYLRANRLNSKACHGSYRNFQSYLLCHLQFKSCYGLQDWHIKQGYPFSSLVNSKSRFIANLVATSVLLNDLLIKNAVFLLPKICVA